MINKMNRMSLDKGQHGRMRLTPESVLERGVRKVQHMRRKRNRLSLNDDDENENIPVFEH
jgi:hypothetical protein